MNWAYFFIAAGALWYVFSCMILFMPNINLGTTAFKRWINAVFISTVLVAVGIALL